MAIVGVILVVIMFLCSRKSQKILDEYDGAFGWIRAFLVAYGLFGFFGFLFGIINLFARFGGMSLYQTFVAWILPSIVLILLTLIILFFTRKKCPKGKEDIFKLTLNMAIVGYGANFILAWRFTKFMLKLVFHINIGGSSSNGTSFPSSYGATVNGEEHSYYLVEDHGTYAIIKDYNDADSWIAIVPMGKGLNTYRGRDDGNIYYPR